MSNQHVEFEVIVIDDVTLAEVGGGSDINKI